MSYLDTPRLHFSGRFLADPSTLNNTPNNFNPNNDFPSAERDAVGLSSTNNLDLFWNPYGQGTFALTCRVSKVTYRDGSEATSSDDDPIVGTAVVSNANDSPAKIVDLDPMQQNVSELWGMKVQVGAQTSGSFSGEYREGPYTWIWLQAKGVPPGDTAGSGMYQSVLEELAWTDTGSSRFLHELGRMGCDRLSINFAVHAHNSAPHTFLVSKKTIAAMNKAGVPSSITDRMEPLTQFRQMPDATPGLIPTEAYFEVLLKRFIGAKAVDQYKETILKTTAQPYQAPTPHPFVHGGAVGAIGPGSADEPVYFTPARVLTPSASQLSKPRFSPYNPPCNFAPAASRTERGQTTIVVNLNNALPTKTPGVDWDSDLLGNLYLCTFDGDSAGAGDSLLDHVELLAPIDYADTRRFWIEGAGIVTITTDADVGDRPLGLARVDDQGKPQDVLLQENPYGIYLRADRFVFRMNPGGTDDEGPGLGPVATADFYASRFGEPLADVPIIVTLMSPEEAFEYTNGTPGTGGSPGVDNISVPQSALDLGDGRAVTDANGKATVTFEASDPGNPRSYVDGQVYFLRYRIDHPEIDFVQAPDDLISIQVYQQEHLELPVPAGSDRPARVTWDNCIRYILGQYGKLYPYMANFVDLGDYHSVRKNHAAVQGALEKGLADPGHMPVTRDLSASRRALVLGWIADGMPES